MTHQKWDRYLLKQLVNYANGRKNILVGCGPFMIKLVEFAHGHP